MPRHHQLRASAETVHWGFFDAGLKPVLTVASGDSVEVTTISGGPDALPEPGLGMHILPEYAEVHARHERDGPHIMTGPIYVSGAEIGDALEVRITEIKLRQDWGYNLIRPSGGTLPEDFGTTSVLRQIPIDIDARVAYLPWGGQLPLSPFFGNIGTAPPPDWGRQTSVIPRQFGGNIDNKEDCRYVTVPPDFQSRRPCLHRRRSRRPGRR
jgi:acetamidase/formamidase